jgi:hypothetical protein
VERRAAASWAKCGQRSKTATAECASLIWPHLEG